LAHQFRIDTILKDDNKTRFNNSLEIEVIIFKRKLYEPRFKAALPRVTVKYGEIEDISLPDIKYYT